MSEKTTLRVKRRALSGEITAPPSKSHTMRAILFATLANGTSTISHYLHSPDVIAMIKACRLLGARIDQTPDRLLITGVSGCPCLPHETIDAGNSGQVLRFVAAIAALCEGETVMTGDHSVQTNRPVKPLISGLNQLGASCQSVRQNDHAPIRIQGPIRAGEVSIDGEDSQPVSALLMACAFLKGETSLTVNHPGETPWIDLTLSWFDRLGIAYENQAYQQYHLLGYAEINAFDLSIPGDFSSIAFPLVAAIITGSHLVISEVDMQDVQGDKAVVDVLIKMGADIRYDEKNHRLMVSPVNALCGLEVDVNDFIDALPILAVVGCFATGETILKNAAVARLKESDRINAMATELKKMGADIEARSDGLVIRQSQLRGIEVESYQDHRIAMSLAVAGLIATGETVVNDVACIDKSYPGFSEMLLGSKFD
jgi:3-phosphoshikimate 1-carboxyvinyltransferase